jgi:hypothetical protein
MFLDQNFLLYQKCCSLSKTQPCFKSEFVWRRYMALILDISFVLSFFFSSGISDVRLFPTCGGKDQLYLEAKMCMKFYVPWRTQTHFPKRRIWINPKQCTIFTTIALFIERWCRLLSAQLTLILLTWKIWWARNNAIKWQIGFSSVFKGLNRHLLTVIAVQLYRRLRVGNNCARWTRKELEIVNLVSFKILSQP